MILLKKNQLHQSQSNDLQQSMLHQRTGKHDLLSLKLHRCQQKIGRKISTNLQWNRWKRKRNHQKALKTPRKMTMAKFLRVPRENLHLWDEHHSKGHKNHWKRLLSLRSERKRKSDSRMNDQKSMCSASDGKHETNAVKCAFLNERLQRKRKSKRLSWMENSSSLNASLIGFQNDYILDSGCFLRTYDWCVVSNTMKSLMKYTGIKRREMRLRRNLMLFLHKKNNKW